MIFNTRFSKIIERIVNIKNIWSYLYFGTFLLILFGLYVLGIEQFVYLVFLMLGFGWSIFFFRKKFNLVEHVLISPALSFCLFVSFIIIFAFFSIKITVLLGYIFILFSLLFFVWKKIFINRGISTKIEKYDLLALLLVILAIFAKTLSVRDVLAPHLHDPITHAFFAREIVRNGFIEFFYSPGLHIFSAFNNILNGENVARQVLLITNFFSGYSGGLVYLYIKKNFNNGIIALVAGLMFSLGFTLSILFSSAGKNALILAICVLLFFMLVLSLNREMKWKRLTLLSLVALLTTFLTHYPVGVFASAYLLSAFLVDIKKSKIQNIVVGVGAVFGIVWMLKSNYYRELEIPALVGNLPQYSIPADYLLSLKNSILGIWANRALAFRSLNSILSPLSIAGLLYMIFRTFKIKEKTNHIVFLLWLIICLAICSVINIFNVTNLLIVPETFSLMLFVFLYIYVSFFLGFVYSLCNVIFEKEFLLNLFSVAFIILVSTLSLIVYQYFRGNTRNVAVQSSDMAVFEWMNENIEDDFKVLNNAYKVGTIVFSSDAGGWLEVYTDNEISMPFYEYGSLETHENLDEYLELANNYQSCGILESLRQEGYVYYYQGSQPTFGSYLGEAEKLVKNGWEIVFKEGNSYLFEIPECE